MAFPTPKRITELDLSSPLTDADQIAVVQGTRTKRATIAQVKTATDSACQCTLVSRYNTVGTDANTTKKYLQTYTLPYDTLTSNGSWLEIYASGLFAANGNTKTATIELKQDSTGLSQSNATTASAFNNDYWAIKLKVQKSSDTTYVVDSYVSVVPNEVTMQTPSVFQSVGDVSNMDWGNDLQICVTGTNGTANANDIQVMQFIVVAHLLDPNS